MRKKHKNNHKNLKKFSVPELPDIHDLPNVKDLKKLTRLADHFPDVAEISRIVEALQDKEHQIKLLSRVIVIMGVLNAVATAPQIYTLYNSQDSGGLSLISWGYYLAFSVILLFYGLLKKQYPLIITYGLSTAAYAVLVTGIVIYS